MTTRERAKAYADAKTKHLEGEKHRDAWWTWFDAYMEIAEAEKAESDKNLIDKTCDKCKRKNTRYCGLCKYNDDAYYEQAIYDCYSEV